MTIFIIALVAFAVLSVFLCIWGGGDFNGARFIAEVAGVFGCLISLLGLAALGIFSLEWYGSAQKAGIINREYGTHYTQAEVFYASSVIDTVRELDRKRYEVNGDFRRAQPDPAVQARREQTK